MNSFMESLDSVEQRRTCQYTSSGTITLMVRTDGLSWSGPDIVQVLISTAGPSGRRNKAAFVYFNYRPDLTTRFTLGKRLCCDGLAFPKIFLLITC